MASTLQELTPVFEKHFYFIIKQHDSHMTSKDVVII
jgi:hypothetical protein